MKTDIFFEYVSSIDHLENLSIFLATLLNLF